MSYSEIVLNHFHNPRNIGPPPSYNAVGKAGTPSAGPFMVIYLQVESGRIAACGFQTFGCGAAIASASMTTELVKGAPISEAQALTPSSLMDRLGGLPLSKEHCAQLAIGALKAALQMAMEAGK